MAVYIRCSACKQINKYTLRVCRKCKNLLKGNSKYKVQVKLSSGKYKTKLVESLALARQIESKWKTQKLEGEVFNKQLSPLLVEVWEEYISWARVNKRSWKDDQIRWKKHIAPSLASKRMDLISPKHVMTLLRQMGKTKTPKGTYYKPATIKQILVLLKRIYNWSIDNELYSGTNPCSRVKAPRCQSAFKIDPSTASNFDPLFVRNYSS